MTSTTTERAAAFAQLYESHLAAVINYLTRRAPHPDAVDVAAETFTIAWRRFDEIPTAAELPWLYGVARRTLANHRRGEGRRSALHDQLRRAWMESDQRLPAIESTEPLRVALEALSEDDRDILLLAGVEELKPAEIAIVLDISPEVARNRLSRARRRLRSAMDTTNEGGRS